MSSVSNLAPAAYKPLNEPRRNLGTAGSARGELHLVPALRPQTLSWPMWLAVALLLMTALLVPMVINTQMASTSYAMHDMQIELGKLLDYQADLVTRARLAQSPQHLAQKASEIGLVPAGASGYISLEDNSVIAGQPAQ